MPTPTMTYISTTDKNLQSPDAVFDATVIANYGDPGLTEDYQADFLSRYVICKLESSNRTLTYDKYKNMIVVVKRPETLWINYQGGWQNNPAVQQRVDYNLNTNVGIAANYSANAIPAINYPYQLGEKIKIKLIKDGGFHYLLNGDNFFASQTNVWDANSSAIGFYQGWHNQGLNSNNYITQNNGAVALEIKTIVPYSPDNTLYSIVLNKIQYEAFELTLFADQTTNLVSLFNGNSNFRFYYETNGGYAYYNNTSLNFNFCKYEDMNLGNKERISVTSCLPLIISSPINYTVPSSRASSTTNYSPTYITKA